MMLKSRKGVEMTFNTIIIAALVLTVLVIIIIILTGAFGTKIVPGIDNYLTCPGRGGHCDTTCQQSEQTWPRFGGCGGKGYENAPDCCMPKG